MDEAVMDHSRKGTGNREGKGREVDLIQDQVDLLTVGPVFDVTVSTDSTGYWLWSKP